MIEIAGSGGSVLARWWSCAGKDAQQHKITFPAVYGLETSRRMAEAECERAHQVLEPFHERAVRLHELADLIVRRKS